MGVGFENEKWRIERVPLFVVGCLCLTGGGYRYSGRADRGTWVVVTEEIEYLYATCCGVAKEFRKIIKCVGGREERP